MRFIDLSEYIVSVNSDSSGLDIGFIDHIHDSWLHLKITITCRPVFSVYYSLTVWLSTG
jgi:hypothetical protein